MTTIEVADTEVATTNGAPEAQSKSRSRRERAQRQTERPAASNPEVHGTSILHRAHSYLETLNEQESQSRALVEEIDEQIIALERARVDLTGVQLRKGVKFADTTRKPRVRAKSARLRRRSAEQIAKATDSIVALVKKHKDGMRAEQIRDALSLDVREMPRLLKEGLTRKVLKKKGLKRATTYTAAKS